MITNINEQTAPETNSELQVTSLQDPHPKPLPAGEGTASLSAGENLNETTHTATVVTRPGATVFSVPDVRPWCDAVDGARLLDELTTLIGRHVVLPNMAAEALALWTVHTYAFELREITAYLGVESPLKRCGKSTLLMVLAKLANRSVMAANISPSALFRVIEQTKPTLIIDEADTFLQGNDELRGIMNAGYTKGTAFVVRVANEKIQNSTPKHQRNSKLQGSNSTEASTGPLIHQGSGGQANQPALARFSCWCPKVMASIGHLPETLADRSIVIRMKRKTNQEPCDRLRDLDGTVQRRMCARFVKDHRAEISGATPDVPKGLNDRACDIWEPLFALADIAGGEWPEKARRAAVELTNSAQEANPIGGLLLDIFVQFTVQDAEKLPSISIVQRLNQLEGRPWRDICTLKELDDKWLAKQLRPYGVIPKVMRFGDKVWRGYERDQVQEVCRRYVSMADLERLKQDVGEPEPSTETAKVEAPQSEGKSLTE